MQRAGATLHHGARASHYRGLSCCRAQAPDAQAQYLWLTGLVAPRHVGSSQTRARTRIPCIGRQTLNHCATRETAPPTIFVLVCVGCYNKNTTHSVAYKQQNFFSQLWKWTSKLRVLAWWREGPLLGCGLPAVSSRDGRHKGSSLL